MKRNFKPMSTMEEAALAQVPGTKLIDKHGCVYTVITKRPTDLSVLGHVRLVGNGNHPEGQIFGTFTMALYVEEPVKQPKPTSVQLAIAANPSLFEQIVDHFKATGRIEISCQPSRIDSEADRLSQASSLSPTDAVDYIKPTTEASHSAKFDIIVSDDIPESLRQFIGTFFKKGLRSGTGEFQINSRSLAEYLMQRHDALPVKYLVAQ